MKLDLRSNLRRELRENLKALVPEAGWGWLKERSHGVRRRVVRSIPALDEELQRVEQAFARSQDEGQAACDGFCFEADLALPPDPHSAEYREGQLELYRRISGRPGYSVENETSPFDLELAKSRPFPYQTGSPATVGDQLIAIGFLIKAMNLAPPAHVLELGPGWGNTTLALLQMGYRVTAVEVDPKFVQLIQHRCRAFEAQLTLVRGDMLTFESERRYDAALFFESFHHCLDPRRLLGNLSRLVSEKGLLVFAGEPIGAFPFPWGVRLDGQSVWSMRRYGWLELGFQTSYFLELLHSLGWGAERFRSQAISSLTDVIVARR
ncbi:MAG: class I SAM-dependent methyltransferase [Myxococcaceae bacterium]